MFTYMYTLWKLLMSLGDPAKYQPSSTWVSSGVSHWSFYLPLVFLACHKAYNDRLNYPYGVSKCPLETGPCYCNLVMVGRLILDVQTITGFRGAITVSCIKLK
jgi:hypothetical protein